MGHTVNSLAKRLSKLEDRFTDIEDSFDDLVDEVNELKEEKEEEEQEKDLSWVADVCIEDFEPITAIDFLCETNHCNNGTYVYDEEADGSDTASQAHWSYIGSNFSVPDHICSECMAEVIKARGE